MCNHKTAPWPSNESYQIKFWLKNNYLFTQHEKKINSKTQLTQLHRTWQSVTTTCHSCCTHTDSSHFTEEVSGHKRRPPAVCSPHSWRPARASYRVNSSRKTSPSSQTRYHVLVTRQAVTANTRASWRKHFPIAAKLKNRALYCRLRQSHHDNRRKFTREAAGEKQSNPLGVVALSFSYTCY